MNAEEVKAGLRCYGESECPENRITCGQCPNENPYRGCDDVAKDALKLIEELEALIPCWKNVKDQPPERGQQVLFVPVGQRKVKAGTYIGEGKCGGHWFRAYNAPTTVHWWMPQPELPKEEE